MQYTVVINQLSITKLFPSIDLKDAAIIDFLHKFFLTRFAAKARIEFGGLDYYWITYEKLISEMPLLKIDNERVMKRRIDKLVEAGILARHPECRELNKTYLAFTEASEGIWSDCETYAPKSTEAYAPESTEAYAPKSTDNQKNNTTKPNKEEVPPSSAASSTLPLADKKATSIQDQKSALVYFLQKEIKARDFLQITDGVDCDKPTMLARFADYWFGIERTFNGSTPDKRFAENSFRVWLGAEVINLGKTAKGNENAPERLDDKSEKVFEVFHRYCPRIASESQKQTVRALTKALFKNGATLDDIELQVSKVPHLGDQFRSIDVFFEKFDKVKQIVPETWAMNRQQTIQN